MASPDYGVGWQGISDFPLTFVFINGNAILGQDLCHRLQTPRGSLAWDLNAGWDMRALFRGTLNTSELVAAQAAIGAECEKDERVNSASAILTFIPQASTLIATITVDGADGPFVLVLSVDSLTVAILRIQTQ